MVTIRDVLAVPEMQTTYMWMIIQKSQFIRNSEFRTPGLSI